MMHATKLHERCARGRRIVAAALAFASCAPVALAAEPSGERRVAVTAEQATTVVGEFDSLKKLLDELCRMGGVEIRAYDADDRAVRVEYEALPLHTVLAELLRRESYILGVTPGASAGVPRVVWLRVTGGPPGVPTAPEDETPAPPLAFEVPSSFGETSFATEDPDQRARALQSVAQSLLTSESSSKSLLAAEPSVVAAALRGYPHAGALLRQLRDEQSDPAMRAKIDAVIGELE